MTTYIERKTAGGDVERYIDTELHDLDGEPIRVTHAEGYGACDIIVGCHILRWKDLDVLREAMDEAEQRWRGYDYPVPSAPGEPGTYGNWTMDQMLDMVPSKGGLCGVCTMQSDCPMPDALRRHYDLVRMHGTTDYEHLDPGSWEEYSIDDPQIEVELGHPERNVAWCPLHEPKNL